METQQDIADIAAHVSRAEASAGKTPWLFAYDANAIQALVTANSRPVAMAGASQALLDFDGEHGYGSGLRDYFPIFAGGGRGMALVPSEERAQKLATELENAFRKKTVGGVLATAWVPYDGKKAHGSLQWLRLKLMNAKEAAPSPGGSLPKNKQEVCEGCGELRASHTRTISEETERLCERCFAMCKNAGKEKRQKLDDISKLTIVAVSADGNNLGSLFSGLQSLTAYALVSTAIRLLFREAHAVALDQASRQGKTGFCPVSGGDDLRVWLPPELLLPYVGQLVHEIETRSSQLAALKPLATALDKASLERLANIGVGIGAVLAPTHFPAARMLEHAHAFERTAKSICRGGSDGSSDHARSAFDFGLIIDTELVSRRRGSTDGEEAHSGVRLPIEVGGKDWSELLKQVGALAHLSNSQRGFIRPVAQEEEVAYANLLRYQVARSREWQAYYAAIGSSWRDPAAVMQHRPNATLMNLARLERPERPGGGS